MYARMRRYLAYILFICFAGGMGAGILFHGTSVPLAPQPAMAQALEPTRVTVAFAGDVLMHSGLNTGARTAEGAYDYAPMFAPIAPYLAKADYTVVNLETRLAGAKRGYSGYPRFNTPDSLATALRDAGVDLLATANNHSLDMGADGLKATLDAIDARGLSHYGTARTPEEQAEPKIVDVNGVTIAFLNATAMTNGIPVPKGQSHLINLIGDGQILITQARQARELGADLVIAYLHYGNEYERQPNVPQQLLAKKLLANGVDVVIGAHPHVVQPIKRITVPRDGVPFTGYIAYSLGNFVSNQRERYRDSGIMVYVDIEESEAGVAVTGMRYLPVYVHRAAVKGVNRYRILPLPDGAQVTSDLPLSKTDTARANAVREELKAHLKRDAAENITMVTAE